MRTDTPEAPPIRCALLAAPARLLVDLAACSSSGSSRPTSATSAAVSTTAPSSAGAVSSTTSGGSATAGKVDANTASQDEVAAALEAAGMADAARWTKEVVEYRPYDTGDPSLASLRKELARYNPAAGVTDRIIAVLYL